MKFKLALVAMTVIFPLKCLLKPFIVLEFIELPLLWIPSILSKSKQLFNILSITSFMNLRIFGQVTCMHTPLRKERRKKDKLSSMNSVFCIEFSLFYIPIYILFSFKARIVGDTLDWFDSIQKAFRISLMPLFLFDCVNIIYNWFI